MSLSQIKLIAVSGKDLDLDNAEAELNIWLGRGYDLLFPPMVIGQHVLFTFGLPSKSSEYLHGLTSRDATQKQVAYIVWAFDVDEDYLTRLKITKKEASKIISSHKETSDGTQVSITELDEIVLTIRAAPWESNGVSGDKDESGGQVPS